jgi:superfamily II DNA or RNA helicase
MISQTDIDFKQWIEAPDFPNIQNDRAKYHAKTFVERLSSGEFPKPLYNHQQEAILRVIFHGEKKGEWDSLLDIVTGGGKTVVMAALVAYFWQVHGIEKFLVLTPNTIVRERVKDDFEPNNPGFAYNDFPLFFNSFTNIPRNIVTKVLRGQGDEASVKDANVIVANIHQLYEGREALELLLADNITPSLVVFNDEAHNASADKYREVLKLLKRKIHARIDLTATPFRLDRRDLDTYPPVYEYHIEQATRDGIVKNTLVTKPDIESVHLQVEEWDEQDNVVRTLEAEDVPWEQIEAQLKNAGAVRFVTAKTARKQQLQIAQTCLEYQQKGVPLDVNGHRQWQPLMLVVALSQKDAQAIYETLQKAPFSYKSEELLLAHSNRDEYENKKAFLLGRKSPAGLEAQDAALWKQTRKVRVIVGISMLREGWDVQTISVICLFRKFSYQKKGDQIYTIYGPQIIGRGLRKIRSGKQIDHLFVIDHPAFNHDWLWQLMAAQQYSRPLNPGDDVEDDVIEKMDSMFENEQQNAEPPVGETGEELDVDKIMASLPDLPEVEPMKEWQAYFEGLKLNTRIANAVQKIVNLKTKSVISANTAHEIPDAELNKPELVQNLYEAENKSREAILAEVRADIDEAPRQALYSSFRQMNAEQLLAMNNGLSWIFDKKFGIKQLDHATDAQLLKLHFALPQVLEEYQKPEVVLGILETYGAE